MNLEHKKEHQIRFKTKKVRGDQSSISNLAKTIGPPDLFRGSSCDKRHETWTALLGRGPGVDRARSALLVAWGMPGELGEVPSALQGAPAPLSRLSSCSSRTRQSQTRPEQTFFFSKRGYTKSSILGYVFIVYVLAKRHTIKDTLFSVFGSRFQFSF